MIDYQDHALLLNESYRHWTGTYLVQQRDPGEVLAELNVADFVLVSQGLETTPIFNYGNVQALSLFGYEHLDFLQLTCQSTMVEGEMAESGVAKRVAREGFVSDYLGSRLTRSGREFVVEQGTVWQLIDNLGRVHGQAARFDEWRFLELDNSKI